MKSVIPYGRQDISEDDIQAVVETLKSDFLTQGPKIAEFEDAFAKYIDSKFAIAVSNGTAALHLSAIALGVGPGQKVITTPITFAASANCVKYCDGEIVFCDIDPETYLLDLNKVRELLEESPKGAYVGIIPVDFAGRPINMEEVKKLANEFDLWIIEDTCHAPGGYFKDELGNNQTSGNGQYADLSIFSFHPVKHIAAGEGGMITTNSEELYSKLLQLRSHGITKKSENFENAIQVAIGAGDSRNQTQWPGWYMEMQSLGYNYRLTDIQAALGLSQLKRADENILKRREIAKIYQKAFAGESFLLGQSGVVDGHAYHLYILEVKDRLGLYNHLRKKSIYTQIHYIPIHIMPFYKEENGIQSLPLSEQYYSRCISLPMYPTLLNEEQVYVINSIKEYYDC